RKSPASALGQSVGPSGCKCLDDENAQDKDARRIVGWDIRSGASPSGLKQLDRVTRGIVDDDLGATRPGHDFARAEWHPGSPQPLYLCLEISDLNVNTVPAAWHLTPTIRERAFAGTPLATQEQPHAITRNRGKGG